MSDSTRIEKLREEVEKLCGNCDRPDKEELGKIILSSMALGFSEGLKAPSADRPQGEWQDTGKDPSHSHPLTAIWYKCSECGDGTDTKTNYCPNCGAKMKQ